MRKFPTVEEAKKEMDSLKVFIELAVNHPELTIEDKVIKLYAYTGSIKEIVSILNKELENQNLSLLDSKQVTEIIMKRTTDPLHRMLRSAYLSKTKHIRKKPSRL